MSFGWDFKPRFRVCWVGNILCFWSTWPCRIWSTEDHPISHSLFGLSLWSCRCLSCSVHSRVDTVLSRSFLFRFFPTGLTLLMDEPIFTMSCCGRARTWQLTTKAIGDIYMQIWRQETGRNFRLIGENLITVTGKYNIVSNLSYMFKSCVFYIFRSYWDNLDVLGCTSVLDLYVFSRTLSLVWQVRGFIGLYLQPLNAYNLISVINVVNVYHC